jgi:hypothetical protein
MQWERPQHEEGAGDEAEYDQQWSNGGNARDLRRPCLPGFDISRLSYERLHLVILNAVETTRFLRVPKPGPFSPN